MRVLAVVPLPPPFTGPEISTGLLLEGEHPFDLRVINTNYRASPEARGTLGLGGLGHMFRLLARLGWQLSSYRPRVVYYSITATRLGWVRDALVITLSRLAGARPLLHFRGGHFGLFLMDTDPLTRRVVKACLRVSWGIIVQGRGLTNMFRGLVRNIFVLANPAPALPQAPYPRPKRVLFVGHLSFAKGYATLLRAVPLVLREVPDAIFAVVGSPKRKETNIFWDATSGQRLCPEDVDEVFQREITQRGLEGHLEFHRNIFGEPKQRLFLSCRVFVLPSYSEGFSMSLAEALAAGLVPVITPVGANREVIRDGTEGFFVAPGDHEALARKIILLLRDDALAESMGRAARERARHFSPEGIRGRFHEIILRASPAR